VRPPATTDPHRSRPPAAYGRVTRALHWATVLALAGQFAVGYTMDADASGRGRGRGRGRGDDSGRGRGRGRGGELDVFDDPLVTTHVALGVAILCLALARVWWRRRSDLPPWAPTLSASERVLAHWTERVLYIALFAMPLSGLWLVLVSDDALAAHVTAHVIFFVALAAHVGLVLKHQLFNRDRLLRRML
jgi:cytochrome b561